MYKNFYHNYSIFLSYVYFYLIKLVFNINNLIILIQSNSHFFKVKMILNGFH